MMKPMHNSPPPSGTSNAEYGDWRAESGRKYATTNNAPIDLPRHMRREENEGAELGQLGFFSRFIRILAATLVLLPLNTVIIHALIHCLGQSSANMENVSFWMRTPIWYSMMGALTFFAFALMGIARKASLLIYIVGHELTHAITILLCGGKIKGMSISAQEGGYVLTNKTNILIALSPYFVPFWMLIWMALIWGFNQVSPFGLYLKFFYFGFGFWWAYHLFWTAYSIVKERQPDLFDNGLLFSLLVIVLINFLLLVGILILFGLITPGAYLQSLQESVRWGYEHLRPWLGATALRL